MVNPIPDRVKKIWDKWNIRGVILFSLSLQTFLIFFAPFRKSTANKLLIMLIWSGYLLADWAANFTVGLISNSQGATPDASAPQENGDLLAFWAPFLLLHLGGPDTITAFALEDNELWLRHLLGLIFQAIAGLYVFIQSLPNRLWISITLLFVTGIIKYIERTRALYLASLDQFRDSMLKKPDPGPNYAKLMEEYASKRDAELPTKMIMIPEPDKESKPPTTVKQGDLNELEIVQYAHKYYKVFKGLVVDLIFSFRERDESREFFDNRTPEDARRIIEVELNFIYEALYTKVEVLHSITGNIFRSIASCSLLAALVVFHFTVKKHEFEPFDVGVTYTLLLGGIALDFIALFMFIFSDWTFAILKKPDHESDQKKISKFDSILCSLLSLKKPWWAMYNSQKKGPNGAEYSTEHQVLETPLVFRRWSGTIAAHNLIGYCLKRRPKRINKRKSWTRRVIESLFHLLGIDLLIHKVTHFLNSLKNGGVRCMMFISIKVKDYSKNSKVIHFIVYFIQMYFKLWSFLSGILFKFLAFVGAFIIDFFGLKEFVDEIRFVSHDPFTKELWNFIFEELKRKSHFADDPETAKRISSAKGEWVLQDSYSKIDRSKLMRYVVDVDYDQSLLLWHIATELCYQTEEETKDNSYNREFSKLLSDYMLYLLIMQPTMMSAVAGIGKIRFRDTCAEAERFFQRRHLKRKDDEMEACKNILSVNTDVEPNAVKGDRSKSVLFDASMLAKELQRLEEEHKEDKWKILSKVWVELVSYAASHCNAKTHAQQISKGGELITFVWLLMAHFGLGEQFQINEGHARAKLIVGK